MEIWRKKIITDTDLTYSTIHYSSLLRQYSRSKLGTSFISYVIFVFITYTVVFFHHLQNFILFFLDVSKDMVTRLDFFVHVLLLFFHALQLVTHSFHFSFSYIFLLSFTSIVPRFFSLFIYK